VLLRELVCSTPCGIEARSTLPCRQEASGTRPRAQRLAASRRGRPRRSRGNMSTATLCSTPCGIEARSTGEHVQVMNRSMLCSTPCGIEARSTPESANVGRGGWQVLNALRHRGEVDEGKTICRWIFRRAQRLAASRRGRLLAGITGYFGG